MNWKYRLNCLMACARGKLALRLRGQGGFGYDPLFFPNGYEQTFAELGEATKNQLSHRAKALVKLKQWFGSAKTV